MRGCAIHSGSAGTKAHRPIAKRQHVPNNHTARVLSFHFLPTTTRATHASATPHPRKNGSPTALDRDFPLSWVKTRTNQIRYGASSRAYSHVNQVTRFRPRNQHATATGTAGTRNGIQHAIEYGKPLISLSLAQRQAFYPFVRLCLWAFTCAGSSRGFALPKPFRIGSI
jgi:hypothetical protein